ncbi:MAG TPA: hypothetical protein VKF41_07795 [Bryobacteraceae bacterium]|nr:hypothetical protein [Bryobacteraceae bacterium]
MCCPCMIGPQRERHHPLVREFAADTPWAHLDIAGTAWVDEEKPHLAKGPTGFSLRTLVRLALDWEG